MTTVLPLRPVAMPAAASRRSALRFSIEARSTSNFLLVGLGGAERLVLRQEEVAGVAVLDGDFVADVTVLADALEQNDFHFGSFAVPARGRLGAADHSATPAIAMASYETA